MKNNKILLGLLVGLTVIVVLVVAFVASSNNNSDSNSSTYDANDIVSRAQQESQSIKDSEKKDFIDIDINKFQEFYNGSDNKIVLFSRPTCGYCQIAEPILQNIMYKYKFDIYHVNTDNMSEDDFTTLKNINSEFDGFGTPLLVVVSNNKIVDKVSGLNDMSGSKEFFKKYNFIKK